MNTLKHTVALRIDDIGASTKRFEVYSLKSLRLGRFSLSGNFLFLKYLPYFKAWGPYREMKRSEWEQVLSLLVKYKAKLTVAVTAAWAESELRIVPFPKKFPQEAAVLKEGVEQGLIEIANHGLCHCVLQNNLFHPKWFSSNRVYHREFWNWIPEIVQEKHIQDSQEILQTYFEIPVTTFVPPGNLFVDSTLRIAKRHGLNRVSCATPPRIQDGITVVGNEGVIAFHDRDLVINGVKWLKSILESESREFCFVKDISLDQSVDA